jgi:hypothetical protein
MAETVKIPNADDSNMIILKELEQAYLKKLYDTYGIAFPMEKHGRIRKKNTGILWRKFNDAGWLPTVFAPVTKEEMERNKYWIDIIAYCSCGLGGKFFKNIKSLSDIKIGLN